MVTSLGPELHPIFLEQQHCQYNCCVHHQDQSYNYHDLQCGYNYSQESDDAYYNADVAPYELVTSDGWAELPDVTSSLRQFEATPTSRRVSLRCVSHYTNEIVL